MFAGAAMPLRSLCAAGSPLTEAELKFEVSLADKTVTIDGCQSCVQTAVGGLSL